jgi:hypothetical protein
MVIKSKNEKPSPTQQTKDIMDKVNEEFCSVLGETTATLKDKLENSDYIPYR